MTDLAEKVWHYCTRYRLLEGAKHIVAGVSGGADSVCLLLVLAKIRERLLGRGDRPFSLCAVHVNHGLRPEAGEDEAWVKELCETLGIPFMAFHEDVRSFARQERLSEEEAGRVLRYRDFDRALEEALKTGEVKKAERAGRIAVAHHADDRAETLLFHLFRGTGLEGMGSIRPAQGRVIRPLLGINRNEIEEYLRGRGQEWRMDNTNDTDAYARNRIRHHILPYAEREICAGSRAHLAAEAEELTRVAAYVHRQLPAAFERCMADGDDVGGAARRLMADDGWAGDDMAVKDRVGPVRKAGAAPHAVTFSCEAFRKEDPFLRDAMLAFLIRRLGRGRDMTRADVAALGHLFSPGCQSGKRVRVAGILAVKEFDSVRLLPDEADSLSAPGQVLEPILPPARGRLCVPGLGEVRFRLIDADEKRDFLRDIPRNQYTKWFDYDKITGLVCFRVRMPGDYLTINNRLQKKKLQDYLIERKIPVRLRDRLPVLADGSHILWVPGQRISAAYKVTEQTRHIWEVTVTDMPVTTRTPGQEPETAPCAPGKEPKMASEAPGQEPE